MSIIVVACPDRRAGNDQKALELAFRHQGPIFTNAYYLTAANLA